MTKRLDKSRIIQHNLRYETHQAEPVCWEFLIHQHKVWVWKILVEGQKVRESGLLPPRWFPEVVKDAQLRPNLQKTRHMMSMTIQSRLHEQVDIIHTFTHLFDARQNWMAQPLSAQDQSYYTHLARQLGGPWSVSMSVCCVCVWCCAAAVWDVRADAVRVSTAGELQIKASRATNSHTADKHAWRLEWNNIQQQCVITLILIMCYCENTLFLN